MTLTRLPGSPGRGMEGRSALTLQGRLPAGAALVARAGAPQLPLGAAGLRLRGRARPGRGGDGRRAGPSRGLPGRLHARRSAAPRPRPRSCAGMRGPPPRALGAPRSLRGPRAGLGTAQAGAEPGSRRLSRCAGVAAVRAAPALPRSCLRAQPGAGRNGAERGERGQQGGGGQAGGRRQRQRHPRRPRGPRRPPAPSAGGQTPQSEERGSWSQDTWLLKQLHLPQLPTRPL